jgi:predicted phage tail protein
MSKLIRGAGGKDGGGEARAPVESPDSLRSTQYANVIDLISEGEIEGLVDGTKSIYLDDTPLQNADGTFNFSGVTIQTRNGTQSQSYIPGFSAAEAENAVGVEVTEAAPVVRSITNSNNTAVRVTLSVPTLTQQSTETGDITGATVVIAIDIQTDGGGWVAQPLRKIFQSSLMAVSSAGITGTTPSNQYNIDVNWTGQAVQAPQTLTFQLQYRIVGDVAWTTSQSYTFSGGTFTEEGISGLVTMTYAKGSKTFSLTLPENTYEFRVVKTNGSLKSQGSIVLGQPQTITSVGTQYGGTVNITGGSLYAPAFTDVIKGKTTSKYQRAYLLPLPDGDNWDIRVRRLTDDSVSSLLNNKTFWDSYTEIIDGKLTYPNSAIIATQIDAKQFSRIPVRAFEIYGIKVQVPSNYDPLTRVYTGAWDGTFITAWTDNPAWVWYDLVITERYGLGEAINPDMVDKWALYEIAQYCDEMVNDGFGGIEPRFTCNLYLQTREQAYQVIMNVASIFRAMTYWAASSIYVSQDAPKAVTQIFTPANVIDGAFNYVGSSGKVRHTVALITWNDPLDNYKPRIEYVSDDDAINRYGVIQTNLVAIGCTSRGQAARVGRWLLYSEQNETETISFKAGLDSVFVQPGNVIQTQDPNRAGVRMGGRITDYTYSENLNVYSEQLNTWDRNLITGVTANVDIAPDGTLTADAIIPNSTLNNHYIEETQGLTTIPDNSIMSFSAHFKQSSFGRAFVNFVYKNGSAGSVEYRFADGRITHIVQGTGNTGVTADYEIDGEYVRLKIQNFDVKTGGTTPRPRIFISDDIGIAAAMWGKTASSVTANSITSPVSGWRADSLIENSTTSGHRVATTLKLRAGIQAIVEVLFRPLSVGVARFVGVGFFGDPAFNAINQAVVINPATGALTGQTGAQVSWVASDEGGGWWKLTGTITPLTTGTASFRISLSNISTNASPSYLGDGISGVYVVAPYAYETVLDKNYGIFSSNPAGSVQGDGVRSQIVWGAQTNYGPLCLPYLKSEAVATSGVVSVDIDSAVTIEDGKTYELSMMLQNGEIETRPVINDAGATTLLEVNPQFTELPVSRAMWILAVNDLTPESWRVVSVAESDKTQVDITAISYRAEKFAAVEDGLKLQPLQTSIINSGMPETPSNLTVVESLYLVANGVVGLKATVSWNSQLGINSYVLTYSKEGENPVTMTTSENTVDIQPLTEGNYSFALYALNRLGRRSQPATQDVTLYGKTTPPAPVVNFQVSSLGSVGLFTWNPATDLDVIVGGKVRFRFSPNVLSNWDSSQDLINEASGSATTITLPMQSGVYFAKFQDSSGNLSTNETRIETNAINILQLNFVELLQGEPEWSGAKVQTAYYADLDGLMLTSVDLWDSADLMDSDEAMDFGGGVASSGTYTLGGIDLGTIQTSRISTTLEAGGVDILDTFDDAELFDSTDPIDGEVISDATAAIFYRATNQDPLGAPIWTDWQATTLADVSARAFEFELRLASESTNHNVLVKSAIAKIDMPDRIESGDNLLSGITDYNVVYSLPFIVNPALALSAENLNTGDYYEITNKDQEGFTIRFYDAGANPISRTFDYIAKGY